MRMSGLEAPKAPRMPPIPKQESPTMMASAFLLDFLYPNGTATLIRRLYPTLSRRIEIMSRVRKPTPRHYMSSTPDRSEPPTDADTLQDGRLEGLAGREAADYVCVEEYPGAEASLEEFEEVFEGAPKPEVFSTPEATLKALLASSHTLSHDKIWFEYNKLEPELMHTYRTDVMIVLGISNRPIEAWRVNELFLQYEIHEWTEEVVYAAVKAELTLQNVSSALAIFETGLRRRGFSNALDLLAAYGFTNSAWDVVIEAWTRYERILKPSLSEATWITLKDDPEFSTDHDVPQTEEGQIKEEEEVVEPEELTAPLEAPGPPPDNGSVLTFAKLSEVPNFASQMQAFLSSKSSNISTLSAKAEDGQRRVEARTFLTFVAKNSLHLFQANDAVHILEVLKDMGMYEFYIALCAQEGRKRMAANLYQSYRKLAAEDRERAQSSKKKKKRLMRDSVLRLMMDVLYPKSARALEQLQQDWYLYYNRLDRRAYLKFMNFYASRGDVGSIMRLVKEFEKHCDPNVQQDTKFVVTLMNAHAVRGDADSAQQVMEDWVEKVGKEPELLKMNILLNAYTREGIYDAAIDLFSKIYETQQADEYTYTTMMKMAAWRGDLQFNLELFEMAKSSGIEPKTNMMMTILEAYCQNDRYAEAERLCVQLTKDKQIAGDYVYLWNVLLRYSAKQRDLTTVNRLLETMTTLKITYNQDTYGHLLLALLYTRQSHHALHLLRLAQKEGGFEPTAGHYALLMSVFIHTGESHVVRNILKLMDSLQYKRSALCMTKAIDALGRWRELPEQRRNGRDGQSYLKEALRQFYAVLDQEKRGSPDDRLAMTNLYSKILFVLTQMRKFTTINEIIELHNTRYPHRSTPETVPLKLLHNIMLADFYEKKYNQVKSTWRLVLERTERRAQPVLHPINDDGTPVTQPKVMYSQRFRLCDPLKTMQRLYLELDDADGLIELIATVKQKGFDLDSKNWNYHIQALARLKRWRHAFLLCEEKLMPQWLGWYWYRYKNTPEEYRLPLEVRRLGSHPHHPRPISHTLLILAKEYMELEQMALWSREAAREFEFIKAKCPMVTRAVTTMERTGSQLEYDILGGEELGEHPIMDDVIMDSSRQRQPSNAKLWDKEGHLVADPLWKRPRVGGHSLEEKEMKRKLKAARRAEQRVKEEEYGAWQEQSMEEEDERWEAAMEARRNRSEQMHDIWSDEGLLIGEDLPPTKHSGRRKGRGKGKREKVGEDENEDVEAALKAMLNEDGGRKK